MEELKGKVTAYAIEKRFGLKPGYIAKYVNDGKVVRDEKKKIDLDHEVNQEFYNHLLSRHDPAADREKVVTSKFKLELEQKRLDIEKRREEIRQLKLKNEKLEGELIPAELVKDIFRYNSKAMTTAFSQALENYLIVLGSEVKMNSSQMAKMRKQIVTTTNEAITEGVKLSLKQITELVNEFSQRRGKGERV